MSRMLYAIGETSRVTGLSIKALRLYQEKGLLQPSEIDAQTGYRFYSERDLDRAHAIRTLRELGFSIDETKAVLDRLEEDEPLQIPLERTRSRLAAEMAQAQRSIAAIDALLAHREQAAAYLRAPPPMVEKVLPPIRAACVRTVGRYSDASIHFPRLMAACGPAVAGPPFELLFDAEYKEDGADLAFCVPLLPGSEVRGVAVEELPEVRVATLVHAGSWDSVGLSWTRLFAHLRQKERSLQLPIRETYLRAGGPGETCLTELSVSLEG